MRAALLLVPFQLALLPRVLLPERGASSSGSSVSSHEAKLPHSQLTVKARCFSPGVGSGTCRADAMGGGQ